MRTKVKWMLCGSFLFLVCAGAGFWFGTASERKAAVEVQRLIRRMTVTHSEEGTEAMNGVIAMGAKAYPELRRIIECRVTGATRMYEVIWQKLPGSIRKGLPEPNGRAVLKRALCENLYMMGPTVCRAMTGAVCAALERGGTDLEALWLLRPLIWSIPESPRAVMTLSNYLARGTNVFLFGSTMAYEVWPKVPQLVPLLAEWLRKFNAAHDVAQTLAALGTNAGFAVPLLIETAEAGVAGRPPNLTSYVSYGPGFDPVLMNRAGAVRALGKLGVTNEGVATVLQKAAESGNEELCSSAFVAAVELGMPITGALQVWAENWNPFEAFLSGLFKTTGKIRLIGKMGERGTAALPTLRRIADGTGMESAARFDHFEQRNADGLRLAAISSICTIAPEEAAKFLPFVLDHFSNWEAATMLREWNGERERIVPAIRKELAGADQGFKKLISAYILLGLDPELEEARGVLEGAMQSADPKNRGMAINWLLDESNESIALVLPAARKLLREFDDEDIQSALNALERMGEPARDVIVDLKPLLVSRHWAVRERAGHLLRKLAPEKMPPIVE